MATTDSELKTDVREFTGTGLTTEQLDTAVARAKRHIEARLGASDTEWYADQHTEEALFWTSCLFTKVASGELDGQDFEAGNIRAHHLDSEEAGTWLKNSDRAIQTMGAAGDAFTFGATTITRDNRVYGDDGSGTDTGGGLDDLS